MLKKLLRYPKIALINTKNTDFFGYKLVLDQEKIPYQIVENIKSEFDAVILPKNHNLIVKDILEYIKKGGAVISSYDYLNEEGLNTILSANINTFTPYGDGIIYYFNDNFGELILQSKYHATSVRRSIIPQWLAYSNQNRISNDKRQLRIMFKNLLYRIVGPLTQIWYWPSPYQSCFSQRIDADFPVSRFHNKDKIIDEMFKIIKDFEDIKFTIFLNYSFPDHVKKIKLISEKYPNVDLQSHGCDGNIKHRDYCYSLDLLNQDEITAMLINTVCNNNHKIFAPPCEQVNKIVLECCQNFGIKFISAGGLAKDDIPRKCFYDGKEYDIYNIPTSQKEFLDEPDITEEYYTTQFQSSIRDNSLFCIYFHPYILSIPKTQKMISKFFYYNVIEEKRKGKLWTPFMKELAVWWSMRDNVDITNGELTFKSEATRKFFSESQNKLQIIKWYPDRQKIIN